jgi:hypothetical protein
MKSIFTLLGLQVGHTQQQMAKANNYIFTRAGSPAAHRLASTGNATKLELWTKIESQYQEMLQEKGGQELIDLDQTCTEMGQTLLNSQQIKEGNEEDQFLSMSQQDLFQVVNWKFGKGKKRNALWKHLKANEEDFIKECTRTSLQKALRIEDAADQVLIRETINDLTELKGVGPATASAILSFVRPDIYTFMDDEIIEALHPGKRDYTLKTYMEVNDKCLALANGLGNDWNVRKVGYTLWTAARIYTSGGADLTVLETEQNDGTEETSKESHRSHRVTRSVERNKGPSKRRKKR